jgi:hypothetical protein
VSAPTKPDPEEPDQVPGDDDESPPEDPNTYPDPDNPQRTP